ncbi:MAG TPA: VIT1/CCC1 transporter family protein [Candidatus Baltobacteraceae bacterium]|nr:VIT1/CCC1 transporter family protein [Candidatus Baltobacteraceae bacterium]
MPVTVAHVEKHFSAGEAVRDVVIGMSDGLTVPFALAAGISGAIAASHVVVTAGIAELAAGGIAMGVGGYLAARTDAEHYQSERAREERETRELPDVERKEIDEILERYGISQDVRGKVVDEISADAHRWVEFMMKFELGLEEPDPRRAFRSALTIGGAYVVGGLIPLVPYMLVPAAREALIISAIVTLLALFVFGFVKGRLTGIPPFRGGLQTLLTGGIAAAVAFVLARLVS